jgi:hypothetical protein
MFCLSHDFKALDIYRSIAEITTEPERTGIDDTTRFFGS